MLQPAALTSLTANLSQCLPHPFCTPRLDHSAAIDKLVRVHSFITIPPSIYINRIHFRLVWFISRPHAWLFYLRLFDMCVGWYLRCICAGATRCRWRCKVKYLELYECFAKGYDVCSKKIEIQSVFQKIDDACPNTQSMDLHVCQSYGNHRIYTAMLIIIVT